MIDKEPPTVRPNVTQAGRQAATAIMGALGTGLLANAAWLTAEYVRQSGTASISGTACEVLANGPHGWLLGLPIPLYGFVTFTALLVLLVRWFIAGPGAHERRFRQLWLARGVVAIASVGLYAYGRWVLSVSCAHCWLSAACSTALFALVSFTQPWWQLPLRLRPQLMVMGSAGAAMISVLAAYQGSAAPPPSGYAGLLARARTAALSPDRIAPVNRPHFGDPRSPTTVVVFDDPVCPVCVRYVPKVIALVQGPLRGRVQLVCRLFPLVKLHPHAHNVALLEAWAAQQGRFAQLAALVTSPEATARGLLPMMGRAGLSALQARAVLGGGRAADAPLGEIDNDEGDATTLGIKGTPYWIILRPGHPTEWVLGSAIMNVLATMRG